MVGDASVPLRKVGVNGEERMEGVWKGARGRGVHSRMKECIARSPLSCQFALPPCIVSFHSIRLETFLVLTESVETSTPIRPPRLLEPTTVGSPVHEAYSKRTRATPEEETRRGPHSTDP